MGEIIIKGIDALRCINAVSTNSILDKPNKLTYSIFIDHHAYAVFNLMIYVFSAEKLLIVVNASNTQKD